MYGEFAAFYAHGGYPAFSAGVARLLPPVLRDLGARPKDLLDLACGEGTFAVAMARRGLLVTGVDRSNEMVRIARGAARRHRARVRFLVGDIRSLRFTNEFDLVTCRYDSLNYLLTAADLGSAFTGTAKALRRSGLFIFDMNTRQHLTVNWQRQPSSLVQDTDGFFEAHRPRYDRRRHIATLHITGFRRRGGGWRRLDEEHRERWYPLATIRGLLRTAGLREIECWGSLRDRTPPRATSPRYWFVTQRV